MSATLLEQVVAGQAPSLLPLTVSQLHQMVQLGILPEGEQVELIEGVLVRKDRGEEGGVVHGPRHALVVAQLTRLAARVEALGAHLRAQLPVTLSEHDEPEPDVAIVRGSPADYADHHPGPVDILAVLEVADTSLEYDRTTKQALYAVARIPGYVIVNLRDHHLEVFEGPNAEDGRYEHRIDLAEGETLRVSIGSGRLEIAVEEIVPPKRS